MHLDTLSPYAAISRAPFLLLPIALTASAAAAASTETSIDWFRTAMALVGLVALHIAVNVLNELHDHRSGLDEQTPPTPFSGGSKTLPRGRLSRRSAGVLAAVGLAIGGAVGGWFIDVIGWPAAVLMGAGIAIIVAYTPLLLRIGLGEIAAGLGLGGLPVLGVGLIQIGQIASAVWALAIPATAMTFNLLLLNEFPDAAPDRASGRRHLVILLGRRRAARVFLLVSTLSTVSVVIPVLIGVWPAWCLLGVAPVLTLAPAVRWAARRPEQPVPTRALAGNVIWNLATHAALMIGFALSAIGP